MNSKAYMKSDTGSILIMAQLGKIDTFTHIVNKDILNRYYNTPQNSDYAIIMEFSPYFATADMEDDSWKVCGHNKRLFLCPSVDLEKNIPEQLQVIEKKLRIRPECHVVGLVIYLASLNENITAESVTEIYDFAKARSLSVVFHTGIPSVHLSSDCNLTVSAVPDICQLAKLYPTVNFIVAQMDNPHFARCLQLIHGIPNIYTCFNGIFTPDERVSKTADATFRAISLATMQYFDIYKQMLYGTDFCPPYHATEIAKYDSGLHTLFTPEQTRNIYWENALRAFPKLAFYIS